MNTQKLHMWPIVTNTCPSPSVWNEMKWLNLIIKMLIHNGEHANSTVKRPHTCPLSVHERSTLYKDSCFFIMHIHTSCLHILTVRLCPVQVPVIWGTVWWSYKVGTDGNPDPEPWILLPAGCLLQSGQEAAGTAALSGDGGTATVTMPQCTSNTKDSMNSPL